MKNKFIATLFGLLAISTHPVYAEYSPPDNKLGLTYGRSIDVNYNCPSGQHIYGIHEKCYTSGCVISEISCS